MNKLKELSQYRTQLMGIAILWVMIFHTNNDFGNNIINKFGGIGYGGVDMFFFLSGFGLYYGTRRKQTVFEFYKKRILRILPAYILVILCVDLLTSEFSFSLFLLKITTLGFWLPFAHLPFFAWYIPAILLLYLIFPFYIKYFDEKPVKSTVIAILIGISLSIINAYIYTVISPGEKSHLMLFTTRIPIFFIGCFIGFLSLNTPCKSLVTYRLSLALFVISFILLLIITKKMDYWTLRNMGFYYYPFIFITPGLCLGLSALFSYLPNCINKIFIFIGKISLEIYLVHETLFYYNPNIVSNLHVSPTTGFIILFAISIIIGYLISKLISTLLNTVMKTTH